MIRCKVVPKVAAAFYSDDRPHVWISIQSPGDSRPRFEEENPNRLDVLFLEFQDSDGENSITESDARLVFEFLGKYKDQIEVIYCQCLGGISRSAGMAAALSLIFNDDDYVGMGYIPNRKVYKTILETYQELYPGDQWRLN